MRRSAIFIDVQTIRLDTQLDHLRADFLEHAGRHVIGRAVGAIHNDFSPLKLTLEGMVLLQNSI